MLFLQATRQSLNDLALEEREYDHSRQTTENGRGHNLRIANAERGLHRSQSNRNGHHIGASKGQMKLFHEPTKAKMATVAMIGFESGIRKLLNLFNDALSIVGKAEQYLL